MASIQIIQAFDRPDVTANTPLDISLDLFFTSDLGNDESVMLSQMLIVALGTDRLALADDVLPVPTDTDRRGWVGDLNKQAIWGVDWPIGWRGWLCERAKITDENATSGSLLAKLRIYLTECLQPFVDNQIASAFDIELAQTGVNQVTGTVTLYRGPKILIALQWQDLWDGIQQ